MNRPFCSHVTGRRPHCKPWGRGEKRKKRGRGEKKEGWRGGLRKKEDMPAMTWDNCLIHSDSLGITMMSCQCRTQPYLWGGKEGRKKEGEGREKGGKKKEGPQQGVLWLKWFAYLHS